MTSLSLGGQAEVEVRHFIDKGALIRGHDCQHSPDATIA